MKNLKEIMASVETFVTFMINAAEQAGGDGRDEAGAFLRGAAYALRATAHFDDLPAINTWLNETMVKIYPDWEEVKK